MADSKEDIKNSAGVPARADTLSPIPEQLPLYRLRPEPSWMGYRTPSLHEASWLGPAIGEDDLNLTACDGTDQVRSSQGERYCDKCWQLLPAPFEPVEPAEPSGEIYRAQTNPTPTPQEQDNAEIGDFTLTNVTDTPTGVRMTFTSNE